MRWMTSAQTPGAEADLIQGLEAEAHAETRRSEVRLESKPKASGHVSDSAPANVLHVAGHYISQGSRQRT